MLAGTLFKEMKNRPNILDEYDKAKMLAAKGRTVFTSPEDTLILEDDTGRIRLTNPEDRIVLDIQRLVSGPVIAVRGRVLESGVFVVNECCFKDVPEQQALPHRAGAAGGARFVCLVSGLHIGDASADATPQQLFADFVSGFLGAGEEVKTAASIVQVIIAGNALSAIDDTSDASSAADKAKTRRDGAPSRATRPLAELDMLLTQLCASVPVLLMPGDSDPSNFTMPQQPLHACMFKNAATFSTFHSTTNPCDAHLDGVHIMGTSGQNIEDIAKYSVCDDRLQCLENTLRWGHLAPTAPDTLPCYPFSADEPFVLPSAPHILFAGNQASFATKLVEGAEGQRVRLVLVPTFATTHSVVLVNIDTLECEAVHFGVPS